MLVLGLFISLLFYHGVWSLPYHEDGTWREIPLKSLIVKGEFFDSLGEVVIQQQWTNDRKVPITSKYKFSLDTNAVVSGFQMKIGEKSWTGVVKAKDTARANFNTAVAAGIKSSLLEKISDNEYQVEIGPISPFESAEIVLHYLTHTAIQPNGSYRFALPTNIARKYINPHRPTNAADKEYSDKIASTPYAAQTAYVFDVDLTWHTGSALQEIVSTTNEIHTEVLSATAARVRCTTAPENGDFSLSVRTSATTGAYSYQSEDGSTYMYVHNQIPVEAVPSKTGKKITIVLDRSGSMRGPKMQEAVTAVDRFLALLPVDASTLINVVSFGSSFNAIYSHSVPATADNIATLRVRVQQFRADYGGTELLHCMRTVVSGAALPHTESTTLNVDSPDSEHVVLLLTDGQIENLNEVLELLKTHGGHFRIMTIGIGRDVDRKLVQQVADITHALSRVLVDESDLTRALTEILSYIDKQYYTNMRVLDYEVSQCATVLYPAHPVDMFLRLSPQQYEEVASRGLIITADDPVRRGTIKAWHIPVSDVIRTGRVLEKLYADHTISELSKQIDALVHNEDRRTFLTSTIVQLSVAQGIMNKHTSFLVISDEQIHPEGRAQVKHTEVPQHDSHSPGVTGARSTRSAAASRFAQPSAVPTAVPSAMPSAMPNAMPSAVPTVVPSAVPSAAPSAGPTLQPSSQTSSQPTTQPSRQPSVQPSSQPSGQPSSQPSSRPSSKPSAQPSAFPTVSAKARTASMDTEVRQDGSVRASQAAINLWAALQRLQQADGSLVYQPDAFSMLDYASSELFHAHAQYVGLSVELFFNAAVLVRLEKQGQQDHTGALQRLKDYVANLVSVDTLLRVASVIG